MKDSFLNFLVYIAKYTCAPRPLSNPMAALHLQNPLSLNLALIVVPNDVQGGLHKVQDKVNMAGVL